MTPRDPALLYGVRTPYAIKLPVQQPSQNNVVSISTDNWRPRVIWHHQRDLWPPAIRCRRQCATALHLIASSIAPRSVTIGAMSPKLPSPPNQAILFPPRSSILEDAWRDGQGQRGGEGLMIRWGERGIELSGLGLFKDEIAFTCSFLEYHGHVSRRCFMCGGISGGFFSPSFQIVHFPHQDYHADHLLLPICRTQLLVRTRKLRMQ